MTNLFGTAPRATKKSLRMTRAEIVARFGVTDLKSARAHLCFRCGASTAFAFGLHHRGEKMVFACKEHLGELQ